MPLAVGFGREPRANADLTDLKDSRGLTGNEKTIRADQLHPPDPRSILMINRLNLSDTFFNGCHHQSYVINRTSSIVRRQSYDPTLVELY
jgi:hypothetical protein